MQKKYEDYTPSQMAKEIIMNSLDLAMDIDDRNIKTELEEISDDYNKTTTNAVRESIKKFAEKTFNNFHSAKFDMSGHPIVDKFNEETI